MYTGPFSDYSKKWANYSDFDRITANDGNFWIDAKTFHRSMRLTYANLNVSKMKLSYLSAFNVTGEVFEQITIASNVNQNIYISAYIYDDRHIASGKCKKE